MAGDFLKRFRDPNSNKHGNEKLTMIQRLRAGALPLAFIGISAVVTYIFWQNFVLNEPLQLKDKSLISTSASQETLDNLKRMNANQNKDGQK